MDTTLSEEEVMIRESARKFLETHCPTKLVREMEKDAKGYPPALWRQAAELGWQGLALPEQYGGSAMPLTYLGLVLEEVGRALAPLPLHSMWWRRWRSPMPATRTCARRCCPAWRGGTPC